MIGVTREQIAVALFSLLQSMGPTVIKTYSRRPALWQQTTAMPALYMGNPMENYVYQHGNAAPAHVNLSFDIFIYINVAKDPNVIPDTVLNNLLDAVETTLGGFAVNGQPQTLGGLVINTWIEGDIHRAPGYINGQGMCLFTVKCLVPS